MSRSAARSIGRRLMFWLTVVIALSSVLVVALIAGVATRNEEASLRREITESTERLARMLEAPLWELDLDRAQRLGEAFASDPRVVRITIRESVSGAARVIERSATTDTVFHRQTVMHDGQQVGDVGLALDRGLYRTQIARDVGIGFAVALIALVTSLIGVRLLLRRLLERPLAELSSVVSSYATGDYSRAGHAIGYGELRTFGEVLDTMGARITRQLRDLQQGNRDLAALNAVLAAAAEEVEPDELLARACTELATLLAMPYAAAGITNEARSAVIVRAATVPAGEPSLVGLVLPASDPAVRTFLRATSPIASKNASTDDRLMFMRPMLLDRHVSGWLALPLVSDGVGLGAIALFSRETREFSEHEVALASRIVGQVSVALARNRARAAERLLRATIEQIPESVFVTDAAERIVYVNPAFTSMNGVARARALGQSPAIVIGGVPDAEPFGEIRATLNGGAVWTGRISVPRSGGKPVICDTVISPVRDARGMVTHHVGIMHDITSELERDERMRHSQRLEAVGQLAGGIAHDFNNILGAIVLQLEYLEVQLDDPAAATQAIHDVRASADRASKLPRQLLMFSRRQAMDVATHDLNVVVGELLRMLGRLIGGRISVTFTPDPSRLPFSGDAGMIEQVVMNLCVNARDAMEQGGRLSLSTHAVQLGPDDLTGHPSARAGRFARLDVKDSGAGMSDEVMARIFEPFYTTKAAGQGTGLGLATTHGIVAQHNGWIEVDSVVGTGTSFHVYIPLTEAPVAAPTSPAPRSAVAPRIACILVVEDEEIIRRVVVRSLQNAGYRLLEAGDATEAERVWDSVNGAVDLVLTDMVMPEGVSGIELTTRLRKEKPDLKVVVMSGYNLDVMAADARRLNVHFIVKPFNLDALSTVVRAALQTRV